MAYVLRMSFFLYFFAKNLAQLIFVPSNICLGFYTPTQGRRL